MKLCIFPNDSMTSYFNKGEIKNEYFNPENYFSEIHIISLFEEDVKINEIQSMAGTGKLTLHEIGKVNLKNYTKFEPKIVELVGKIKPNLIRAYNPLIQGWMASKCSKKLEIPYIISLHTNYDQQRKLDRNPIQFLKKNYLWRKLEKTSISNANAVICVYEFIIPYAKKNNAKNIELIYNKIDLRKFCTYEKNQNVEEKPLIVSVGRLIEQKDHMYILKAVKNLDVKLTVVGDGPNYSRLNNFIVNNKMEDQVKIIKRISNEKLPQLYNSAQIYVQPLKNLDGIPIPVLEAMACGLPVVMSEHKKNYSQIIDSSVIYVKNDHKEFRKEILNLLNDKNLVKTMKEKSKRILEEISGEKMIEKEIKLLDQILEKKEQF